ncbi:MAG: CRISPR-associated CARF protein Csa3 [Candidatus Caldarchaeum sp.]|uniref:CRISPR locus-related DNA-binding protein n=1 Tax=Caldiarchaeum subterraneum TaxID=311458 RepID=A0A7J3G5A7_CALS0|nr:CRISPR-associated CARF protein Csa3 [Candidatus Caldarchaeales archaeon]MDJ0272449.1 CRISPR-associated CARF protein Csa3 [Candidatus Caldarchaeales archaeon]
MRKTIMVTLGYTEWPVVSSLVKHGLESGDRIVTIIPSKSDARSAAAIQEIRNFLSKFSPGVSLEVLTVDVTKFEQAVATVLKRLFKEKKEGRNVIVNLSGGMRILILETYTALLLSGSAAVSEIVTEDKQELALPSLSTVSVLSLLKESDLRVLEAAKNSESVVALAKTARLPLATAYRRVVALEKMGLLATVKRDRVRTVSLTALGRVVLEVFPEK